jgi:hypothetical protein
MTENTRDNESLLEKLFMCEIGSAESRAAARRLIEGPRKAPNVLFVFVNPPARDCDDRPTSPVEINSLSGTTESNKKLIREEGETQESFESRVAGELPALGPPRLAFLFPDAIPPDAPPPLGQEPDHDPPAA